ncbi:MAG: type II toxin-antitoxin system RelE/ParE family toxin [Rhodospirillales bacterium]
MQLLYYVTIGGDSPFRDWYGELEQEAARRVTVALERLAQGNVSNVKSTGGGLYEVKVGFGPGYRVYFGYDGPRVVVLLGGGTKRRQDRDIAAARGRWADYQMRRRPRGATWH